MALPPVISALTSVVLAEGHAQEPLWRPYCRGRSSTAPRLEDVPTTPLLEIVLRGSVMYLSLFTLLRVVLKRQAGTVGITDLLVVVLIADAAQNGMAGEYKSITEGLLLVGVIIFWSFLLDWLGYRFESVRSWIHPPPLLLVKDGRFIRKNMRKEFITEDELMGEVRKQGVDELKQVRQAFMEGDGHISVLKANGKGGRVKGRSQDKKVV